MWGALIFVACVCVTYGFFDLIQFQEFEMGHNQSFVHYSILVIELIAIWIRPTTEEKIYFSMKICFQMIYLRQVVLWEDNPGLGEHRGAVVFCALGHRYTICIFLMLSTESMQCPIAPVKTNKMPHRQILQRPFHNFGFFRSFFWVLWWVCLI